MSVNSDTRTVVGGRRPASGAVWTLPGATSHRPPRRVRAPPPSQTFNNMRVMSARQTDLTRYGLLRTIFEVNEKFLACVHICVKCAAALYYGAVMLKT